MPVSPRSYLALIVAVPVMAAGLTAADLMVDPAPAGAADLAVDFLDRLLMLGAVCVIAVLVVRTGALERRAGDLRRDLGVVSEEAERWRGRSRRLLDGLGEAIASQFRDWDLTPAEAEIAGLMLKGLALRDIAVLRRTSEATIRQQAQGIYRKSGLANRTELAAFFLEDLFDAAGEALPEPVGQGPGGGTLN